MAPLAETPGTSRFHFKNPNILWTDVVLPDGRLLGEAIKPFSTGNSIETWKRTRQPQVCSHRGEDGYSPDGTFLPDNSIPAFRKAQEVVGGFEFDTVGTADNVNLIVHNFHGSRQTTNDKLWSTIEWNQLSDESKEVIEHKIVAGKYTAEVKKTGLRVQTLDDFLTWKAAEAPEAMALGDARNMHSIPFTAALSHYPAERRRGVVIQILNFIGCQGEEFVVEVNKLGGKENWQNELEFVVSPNKDALHLTAGIDAHDPNMAQLREGTMEWIRSYARVINVVAATVPILGAWKYCDQYTGQVNYPGVAKTPPFNVASFFAKDRVLYDVKDDIRKEFPDWPIIVPSTTYAWKDAQGNMYRVGITTGELVKIDMNDPMQKLTMLASLPQAPFKNGGDIAMTDRVTDALYYLATNKEFKGAEALDAPQYNEKWVEF